MTDYADQFARKLEELAKRDPSVARLLKGVTPEKIRAADPLGTLKREVQREIKKRRGK